VIAAAAREVSADADLRELPAAEVHGAEPPPDVVAAMREAAVVFAATRMSLAHTRARLAATDAGTRWLSLPDYSLELMARPALRADFRGLTATADELARRLTNGRELVLTSPAGTRLVCDIGGRTANSAPGWCRGPGSLASPPDAEANVAPREDGSHGTIVVDGSVPTPELGPLTEPLVLTVRDGRVVAVDGPAAGTLEDLLDRTGSAAARVVAEVGFGLNPLAELTGAMLEDEGCVGTAHVGLGSNATIGGRNAVAFHLDHVFRDVRATVDGAPLVDAQASANSVAG
jgi:leucyl aminopeptidase (aminopeptidase T)